MISNQPAQLIGDLSQNAGAFATQQAQQQAALERARFADQQQQGAEQLQMHYDQMAQRERIANQQMHSQQLAKVLGYMTQEQLAKMHDEARMQQIAAQGGNQQTLAGINNASRDTRASQHDTTQQRGQDLRTGVAYDRMGQQSDQFDAAQQQKADQFGQMNDLRQQGMSNLQGYRDQRLAQGADRTTVAGQQQERLRQDFELKKLTNEARILNDQIKADWMGRDPETQNRRARFAVIGKEIASLGAKVKSAQLAQTAPPVQPPPMGIYAGDATPDNTGLPPAAVQMRGMGINPNIPQSIQMQQQSQVNTDVIRQLVLEGYTNEEIKAMIRGQ